MQRYRHEQVAKICYAALRQLREEQGEERGPVWDLLTDEEQQWFILCVELARQSLPPQDMHAGWRDSLRSEGWCYGELINHAKKTHPELTEWSALSGDKRLRYTLVQMMSIALTLDVPAVWGVRRGLSSVTAP